MTNTQQVYAIRDTVANDIIGGLHLFPADAPAVRFFNDVAAQPNTVVSTHVTDHELICIGTLTVDEIGRINLFLEAESREADYCRVVITGSAWLATQKVEEPTT